VKGGAYPRAIHALKDEMTVVQRPCQVFVALAEEGWTESSVTTEAAKSYLGSLFEGSAAPDTIVLGCTHFPVLASAIRQVIGDDVAIVDSAETTAAAVVNALAAKAMRNETGGASPMRFFATDSPERFARVGAIFLGRSIDIADVELIDLRS
jgi:glutamate racemase